MPWLILGILADIFFRINCEFKRGTFGEVHDLREVFKGEVVTIDFALNGINGIFSTGIVDGNIELGQMQGDGSGTKRGLGSVKVSFGFFFLDFKHPSSSDLSLIRSDSLSGRERGTYSVCCPSPIIMSS